MDYVYAAYSTLSSSLWRNRTSGRAKDRPLKNTVAKRRAGLAMVRIRDSQSRRALLFDLFVVLYGSLYPWQIFIAANPPTLPMINPAPWPVAGLDADFRG